MIYNSWFKPLAPLFQFIDSESVPEDSVEDSLPETDLEADKDDKMAPTYDEAFPPLAGKAGAVGGMAGKIVE